MTLAALLAMAATAASGVPRDPGPHYAFVGEFVSLREMQPCNQNEPIPDGKTHLDYISQDCRGFYQIFQMRYRVVAPLAGAPPMPEVEFFVADHYGKPAFIQRPNALFVVSEREDGAWMQYNLGFGVLPLRNGGWAACGSPTESQDDDGNRLGGPLPRPLDFAKPLLELRADDDPAWVAELRADPELRVEGETVHCLHGVPVAEILDDLRGDLAEEGVILEPAPAKS